MPLSFIGLEINYTIKATVFKCDYMQFKMEFDHCLFGNTRIHLENILIMNEIVYIANRISKLEFLLDVKSNIT